MMKVENPVKLLFHYHNFLSLIDNVMFTSGDLTIELKFMMWIHLYKYKSKLLLFAIL